MTPRRLPLLALAVALAAAGCTGGGGGGAATPAAQGSSPSSTASPAGDGVDFSDIPGIVRRVEPSVVTIRTPVGLGSGIVYKANGVIVTAAHVVERENSRQPFPRVQVRFADGKQVTGRVLATDDISDVAVLKVDRTGLPTLRFAADLPSVGSLAVAIGSPLGLQESVSAGIISALQRKMPPSQGLPQGLTGLIQTDAAISPGNSGGALVDARNQVIGMNEAYLPPSTGAVAIGFATPAPTVTDVADQLLAKGRVSYAFLGVQPAEINPQVAQAYNLPSQGVLVTGVVPGSPAASVGLRPGDVIVSIAGRDVASVIDLIAALRKRSPGEKVKVSYVRDGKRRTATVTLANRPRGG